MNFPLNVYQLFTYCGLSLAETFILHRLLSSFLTRNKVLATYYKQGLAGYFIFQLFSYVLAAPLFSTAALYFVFTLLLATPFYLENLSIKIQVASMFVVLNYACKLLSVTVLMGLGHRQMPVLPHDLVLDGGAQIGACLLFWSCVLIIIGCRNLRLSKHDILYTVITYIVHIGILGVVIRLFTHIANGRVSFIYLDAAALLFCTTLAIFYLLDKTLVIHQTSEQKLMAQQLLTIQQRSYQQLEQFQKEIQSIRHDLKNHMKCVLGMLEQQSYDEARGYMQKLCDNASSLESPIQCGNSVADIVLNHGLSKARAQGVDCTLNVLMPSKLPVDDLDLCTLFGNLVDNAVEACSRITDHSVSRYIQLDARVTRGCLVVKIQNSFNGEVRMENNIYQTVKTGERFCGIGLSNIRKVAEKYGGEISIHHSDSVFTVSAMLPLGE